MTQKQSPPTNNYDFHQIPLYRKVTYPSGAVRYIETEKIYDYEIIKPGCSYIVRSLQKGGISTGVILEEITPNYAPILTALLNLKDEATQLLLDANTFNPSHNRDLSDLEKAAWKAYKDVMGDNMPLYFEGISMHDLVEQLIDFLKEKIKDEDKS